MRKIWNEIKKENYNFGPCGFEDFMNKVHWSIILTTWALKLEATKCDLTCQLKPNGT